MQGFSNNLSRPLHFVVYATAGVSGMAGLAVLAGWVFGIPALKSVVPGFIAMQPWTALSFVMGAVALLLAGSGAPAARAASAVPATVLAMCGGMPLMEYLTGRRFGTDLWLFPTAVVSAQPHAYRDPGRMSLAAAVGLTVLAEALLLAPRVTGRPGRVAFSTLATAGLVTAVVALLGYALRLEPLDAMFLRNPLALHSALALALLSIGTLALRPDAGWVPIAAEQGTSGWVTTGLLGVAGLLLAFGTDAAVRAGTIAARAAEATARLEILLSTLKDGESGERGYLLTQRAYYLGSYEAALSRMPDDLAAVEGSLTAVMERPAELGRLRGLVRDKMAVMAETIALLQEGRAADALALVETDRGLTIMNTIRAEVASLEHKAGDDAAVRSTRARRIATVAAIGIMLLAVMAFWALAAAARVRRRAAESLAESEARQRDLLATLGIGTFMARDLDGTIRFWADGCARLYGWTAAEAVGRCAHQLLRTVFPVPLAEIEAALVRTGEWHGDLRHRTLEGRQLVVTAHKVLRRAADGQAGIVLEALTDVTAQRDAERAWHDSEALLRTVIETTRGLIFAKDRQGRMLLANSAFEAVVGKPWAELAGRTDREFLDDPEQGEAVMAIDRQIMATGRTREVEETVTDPTGRTRVWVSTKTPMRNAEGEVFGIVGLSVDITDRKLAEERLRLMVNELNHRVKNTLSTVQAIASQTLRGDHSVVRETFEGRLAALAAVHDVLTREAWKEAALHDVIAGALAPHGGMEGGVFEVSGPPLRLQPRVAVALSMALHELATNATKFGALSFGRVSCGNRSAGHVAIRWKITRDAEPRLRFTWSEADGPVVAEPVSRGFGMRLIERSLALDMGGTVQIVFKPDGVVCVIDAPLAEVAADTTVIPFLRVDSMRGT